MKELAKAIRRILTQTAAISGILMLSILIFMNIISTLSISRDINPALTLSTALVCLTAAFLIALCNCILRIRSISLFVRTILHFIACLLSVILTLSLGEYEFKSASVLLIVAFAVAYLLIVPPYLAISYAIHRKSKENEDYDSIFSAPGS